MRLRIGGLLCLATAVYAPAAHAQVSVTGPSNGVSCIPFACAQPGSRYQQVYRASAFSGPIAVGSATFFHPPAGISLPSATFDLYLSTTAAAVDALNNSDFGANLGASTALFGTFTIGGDAPAELTFAGVPYVYDPSAGNLLVDLRFRGPVGPFPANPASFLARNDLPGGNYSRAQNIGAGNAGYGLDTRFGLAATTVPEPTTVVLLGGGLLVPCVAGALRRRRGTSG